MRILTRTGRYLTSDDQRPSAAQVMTAGVSLASVELQPTEGDEAGIGYLETLVFPRMIVAEGQPPSAQHVRAAGRKLRWFYQFIEPEPAVASALDLEGEAVSLSFWLDGTLAINVIPKG